MREICTSGSVGGEDGNILTYPAASLAATTTPHSASLHAGDLLADPRRGSIQQYCCIDNIASVARMERSDIRGKCRNA